MSAVSLPLLLPVTPKVVIAADQPLFRDSLKRAVLELCPAAEVDETHDFASTRQLELRRSPLLLLLDLDMSSARGLIGLQQIHSLHPALAVAVLSVSEDLAFVQRALATGACGFVPKSTSLSDLSVALHCLLSGRCWTPTAMIEAGTRGTRDATLATESRALGRRMGMLSPQQLRIAMLVAEGLLNKQIGRELDISENTVKVHVSTILQRLRLSNRTQLAVMVGASHQLPDGVDPMVHTPF